MAFSLQEGFERYSHVRVVEYLEKAHAVRDTGHTVTSCRFPRSVEVFPEGSDGCAQGIASHPPDGVFDRLCDQVHIGMIAGGHKNFFHPALRLSHGGFIQEVHIEPRPWRTQDGCPGEIVVRVRQQFGDLHEVHHLRPLPESETFACLDRDAVFLKGPEIAAYPVPGKKEHADGCSFTGCSKVSPTFPASHAASLSFAASVSLPANSVSETAPPFLSP